MSELEWIQRTLVEPGLLAPARLDGWLRDWRRESSLLRHLVAVGVLDSPAARTISAVINGYVQMPPLTVLRLFRGDVPEDMPPKTSTAPDPPVTAAPVPKDSTRIPTMPPAGSISPGLRAAVDAAISGERRRWPAVGEQFAGYDLRRLLSSGRNHVTYRARRGEQRAIVKLLPAGDAAIQRAAYSRLSHPAIAPLLAAGKSDGLGYLVFDDHAGMGLDEYSAQVGPLGFERVIRLGVAAAEGLAAAAQVGVVHGDLEPARLRVRGPEAHVELLDFMAPIADETGSRAPAHRAPEQRTGAPASPRSDMYSLGVALHLAATGRIPATVGLRTPLPGLPYALSAVIGLLLQPQPERRPTSWAQVSSALLASRTRARAPEVLFSTTPEEDHHE